MVQGRADDLLDDVDAYDFKRPRADRRRERLALGRERGGGAREAPRRRLPGPRRPRALLLVVVVHLERLRGLDGDGAEGRRVRREAAARDGRVAEGLFGLDLRVSGFPVFTSFGRRAQSHAIDATLVSTRAST